ncbi:MAG TPA: hypothetical protein VKY22_26485 [Bradyrhizobium sp.]|nr:hypothetical protein [Bradyrhizobium sp.]
MLRLVLLALLPQVGCLLMLVATRREDPWHLSEMSRDELAAFIEGDSGPPGFLSAIWALGVTNLGPPLRAGGPSVRRRAWTVTIDHTDADDPEISRAAPHWQELRLQRWVPYLRPDYQPHCQEEFMSEEKSILREFVEGIEGVSRTHYEIEIKGSSRRKTLVVEVDFDLDPGSPSYSRMKVDAIADGFAMILREENGDLVSKLKIIGRSHQHADKSPELGSSKVGGSSQKAAPANLQSSSH